jgi:hypothetical protein
MKLKNCLDIGIGCGLDTVGECVYNIDLRAGQIFNYSKISEELDELINDRNELYSKTNFTKDSSASDVLSWINLQDDDIDTKDLNL